MIFTAAARTSNGPSKGRTRGHFRWRENRDAPSRRARSRLVAARLAQGRVTVWTIAAESHYPGLMALVRNSTAQKLAIRLDSKLTRDAKVLGQGGDAAGYTGGTLTHSRGTLGKGAALPNPAVPHVEANEKKGRTTE